MKKPTSIMTSAALVGLTMAGAVEADSDQKWAIRHGGEPIDLHGMGLTKGAEEGSFLYKYDRNAPSIAGHTNHNYFEIGTVDGRGDFTTHGRISGVGVQVNNKGELEMVPSGRSQGLVLDGEHTSFNESPIQRDDPHDFRENQLQHADAEDYTEVVLSGGELEVKQVWAEMVQATVKINNDDPAYSILGPNTPLIGGNGNSNTHAAEMNQIGQNAAQEYGLTANFNHNIPGWDMGWTPDHFDSEISGDFKDMSLEELNTALDGLYQVAAGQLQTVMDQGIETDVEVSIPEYQ